MFLHRKANERGGANHGWLNAKHTFSFANYYDPNWMGFRKLRVMNEDRIQGQSGFGTHPHRDMEIITFVMNGELTHQDSMGHKLTLRPGEIQRMSAGSGILHSEHNTGDSETHLYQIWIETQENGMEPSYEQKEFKTMFEPGLHLLASPTGENDSVKVFQDIKLFVGNGSAGDNYELKLDEGRHGWIQIVNGKLKVNDIVLNTSDGLAISEESEIPLNLEEDSQILFFDLN